jgi:hypothetical protein
MTSGGLGTMGYGLPAALGVQIAHPDALVIDIAGDASVQMTMQEMSDGGAVRLPIKIFILNNQYMGMVRQWQQLLHGNRLSHSYTEAMPDFVKLAEAYGGHGIRCEKPGDLDDAIKEMIDVKKPVLFDCRVANLANCFPMIPSGKAHNEMLLPDEATDEAVANAIDAKGRSLSSWFDEKVANERTSFSQPTGSAYFIAKETEKPETAHALGAGRQRAGRAGPRHRPVLRARLQYREPHRLGDRAREASVAHHHRDARHAACAGADQAPARAHRAGAPGGRPDRARRELGQDGRSSAELALIKVAGTATPASRRCAWPMPSAPR